MIKKFFFSIALLTMVFCATSFSFMGSVLASSRLIAQAGSNDLKSADFTFDVNVITPKGLSSEAQVGWFRKGINYAFERAITIMAAVIGSIAVLIMTVGGFKMIISAGDQAEYDKGKNMIIRSALGLAFVLSAYILVTAVQLLIKSIYGG